MKDSELINLIFEPLIKSQNIRNKNKELLFLDKSRTSLILTYKANVPKSISNEYHFLKTNPDIRNTYLAFFKKCILDEQMSSFVDSLKVLGYQLDFSFETQNIYNDMYTCFINSLCTNNIKSKIMPTQIWSNGCNSINFVSGDIFNHCFNKNRKKEIIVIPVNTYFDVQVTTNLENTNPIISSQTLHGKWIQRCKNANIKEDFISNKIQNFLLNNYKSINDNLGEYSIGTVVPFETNNGATYLLATSRFDEQNVAHANIEDVHIALKKLIKYYDYNGQGYPLYIPLIGTGRSRANLSNEESLNLIVEVLQKSQKHVQGTVNIIALPEVYNALIEKRKLQNGK